MRLARLRLVLSALWTLVALPLVAQDRLESMPGYDRCTLMTPRLAGVIKSGLETAQWTEHGKTSDFQGDGKGRRFDVDTRQASDAPTATSADTGRRRVGPDAGHSGINQQRMMEFFIESLVLRTGGSSAMD